MFETVGKLKKSLRQVVGALEHEVLAGDAATRLVEDFAEIERLAAAGKALAARRVATSGAWQGGGDRSPAHWVARTTGTSVGTAVGVLETAERLSELPQTDAAVRAGELSEAQAKEIASAAASSPSAESELIEVAKTESVTGLRARCAQVRAAAAPDEASRYEAIRARRRVRTWTDAEGAFRMDTVLTPDAGAVLLAALEPHQQRIFAEARRAGRREPYEAYGADALMAVAAHARDCDGDPVASGPRAMIHVVVDHSAFVRGETQAGEKCEIAGVGPVPVATARALASDAIMAALVTDGTDISTVSHMGRSISAPLRTAVIARDHCCVVPGCDVRHGLEIDHILPRHEHGPTKLVNLARLCKWHHYLKTFHGYVLAGPPGSWSFAPPEHRGPSPPGRRKPKRANSRPGPRAGGR